jgi:disulfide bond formation protein DsbB
MLDFSKFRKSVLSSRPAGLVANYALNLIFVISLSGTLISLYFSEFMDLAPCDLCWYQRIFFYPIAVISFAALLARDKSANIYNYILYLALIGLPISIYNHLLKVTDIFPKESPFCDTYAGCSKLDWELIHGSGITIPFLCGVAFSGVIIIVLMRRSIR